MTMKTIQFKNSPYQSKQQDILCQNQNSRSRVSNKSNKEPKYKCPTCMQAAPLMCYACCYTFTCQKCYTSTHFLECKKEFNKYSITLSNITSEEQNILKKNRKKSKQSQKCQRCQQKFQQFQYCEQCKLIFCFQCSTEVHLRGKFSLHNRHFSNQFQPKSKRENNGSNKSEELGENCMKKYTKENVESSEYGLKVKEKAIFSTPITNKNGRSITKGSLDNQQNQISTRQKKLSYMKRSSNIIQSNKTIEKHNSSINNQKVSWLTCKDHHKIRCVLTEHYELLCQECYDQVRVSTSKLKNLDLESCLGNEININLLKLNLQGSLEESNLKMQQLSQQFTKYRENLLQEYSKMQQIVSERYNSNLFNLQKWEKIYTQSLTCIREKCKDALELRDNFLSNNLQSPKKQKNSKKEIEKLLDMKLVLSYEQTTRLKRQYHNQQQQYQFKVNDIKNEYFEEVLKNFVFVRRKIENEANFSHNQKSLSKMSQSNQLRQSRLSNSSIKTDRKALKRDDSFQKSNYYDLSNGNNLLKRSMSKQIKQDISQKILFPKSDKKQYLKISQINNQNLKKSQYFFENINQPHVKTEISKRQPLEISNYGFKEIKYINLQNMIGSDQSKIIDKQSLTTEQKLRRFANQLEISTELVSQNQTKEKQIAVSQTRLTHSINISMCQSNLSKMIPDATPNSSANSSIYNKNKRKSDYMEMRDRLRKPNIIHKIGK